MESNETLLTQEFAKKLKDQLKKSNGVRLPRRKFVPRNPRLYMNHVIKPTPPPNEELEEGEIPRETPLNSLMAQFSSFDQQSLTFPEPQTQQVQIKPDPEQNSPLSATSIKEEITVTPDVSSLTDSYAYDNNQINLKKIRATLFPCPLCPMEATQGHIRFHLHSVHGETLRNVEQLNTCLICRQQVKSRDILSHSFTHDLETGFDCNFCDERFFYKTRLDAHLEKVHETYSCEFCEMTFFSRKEWKSHTTTKLHKVKKFAQEELKKQGINVN